MVLQNRYAALGSTTFPQRFPCLVSLREERSLVSLHIVARNEPMRDD